MPLLSKASMRNSIAWYCGDSLCYFDVELHPGVRNYVALTIDDVPCRLGPTNSMMPEVKQLLKQHEA